MEAFPYRFLSFLETREQRLLSWGFYDVSFTVSEIESLLQNEGEISLKSQWQDLAEDGWSMEEFVDEMSQANLLFAIGSSQTRFRTRFAETVRLTARLKQMFKDDQWSTGPNLVSDIKLHLKPRRYPKRDLPASDCWGLMEEHAVLPEAQRALFEKLSSNATGKEFSFSEFQKNSFSHILSKYNSSGISGSVICAGTGAGKTKGFYIPAILGAATELNEKPFTKIIAIYPRNVLLADQFREALSEVLKLNQTLQNQGSRPFRLGALLGPTPYENWFENPIPGTNQTRVEKYCNWRRVGRSGDFVIPYLKSPLDADADLVWRESDRKAGRTCLYRSDGTSSTPDVPNGMLALTREELMKSPPDILFLSSEMLNRELGNPKWSKTFGIREKKLTPRLLLLDEVHSYEGIQGAQVAWILRRWRHATQGRNLHVVGLSATLKQAPNHLAQVAAIKKDEVVEFTPSDSDLEEESMEYNIAVKGDPSSGTSLLSTSIQCGMLLARCLTPANHIPNNYEIDISPECLFTKKVFGFTDNMDVVNRWLSNMTDAERQRLARYRLHPKKRIPQPDPFPSNDELKRREGLGQIWDLPRRLGYELDRPIQVGRCSSQDPGVSANKDLVIATSSLEVGFDDPQVGAVMQHKRPMSIASFIQRKGRAGRVRGSRPWTMVVLSDYGGDRFAFQEAERLFEPELDELNLPCQNQYVLRIQATFFLIDWLGRRVGRDTPFNYLRRPANNYTELAQERARDILEDFINQGVEWQVFREEAVRLFAGKLGPLTESQVDSLFWERPRPLLRQVIPCLLRKLEKQWFFADPRKEGHIENRGISYPLPEFLPSATFAELDVTETRITFRQNNGRPKDDEFLDVSQVLDESCPGRASQRYSTLADAPAYWHEYSTNLVNGNNSVSAKTLYPSCMELGVFEGVRVFQPVAVCESHCPDNVSDSSNGSWNWRNSFQPFGTGYAVPVFSVSNWKNVVESVTAFLHRDQSGINVIRYADSFDFEIRSRGEQIIGTCELHGSSDDGGPSWPEGVGFHRKVDGIQVRLDSSHLDDLPKLPEHLTARFRSDYYLHVMKTSDAFPHEINVFLRDWIWQISLAMLTATALRNDCTLEEAQQRLEGKRLEAAERVIEAIFHIRDPGMQSQEGRLVENIRAIWRNEDCVNVIRQLERLLWDNPGTDFHEWVRDRYVATLAQAIRVACVATDLEINENDLFVDVIKTGSEISVYLTEKQSGGLGVIEQIAQQLSTDPSRFHNGIRHVLGHCQRERTTDYLRSVVEEVQSNDLLAQSFNDFRSAVSFTGQEKSKSALQVALFESGFDATRERFVSLTSNVLKPGSTHQTDELIRDMNNSWHEAESRLQVGIDSRVYAYSAITNTEFSTRIADHFQQINAQVLPTQTQLYNATERFLLPICPDSCRECLTAFNRYNDFGMPSRELANLWLRLNTPTILIASPGDDWLPEIVSEIAESGLVAIRFPVSIADAVLNQLNQLFATEVEVGILLYPISVQRVEKSGNDWVIVLQLRDLIHA
ncbi:MAG: hypothetical protein CMJ82_05250 [Planctomycetaceae bacterium]|nr:hypothetical protein [Planctomycetaceae bacterium]